MKIVINVPTPEGSIPGIIDLAKAQRALEYAREAVKTWKGRLHPEGIDAGDLFENATVEFQP